MSKRRVHQLLLSTGFLALVACGERAMMPAPSLDEGFQETPEAGTVRCDPETNNPDFGSLAFSMI